MTLREIFFSLGYEVDKTSEAKAEQSIKSVKSFATKLLGAIGIGFSLTQINAISEEFNGINNQIRNATKGLGDQKAVQKQILSAANAARTAYGFMAKTVSDLVQNDNSLFGSVEEAAEFASLTTKLFKTAGKAEAEIQGLQEALNKSFAKGIVDSETLNQLYEKAPEAINMISKSLGVSREKLLEMASAGRITTADLKNAFTSNAAAINADFANLGFNISDALLNIRNRWGLWVDDMNTTLKISQTIGTAMVKGFTKFMDVLRRVQTRVEWLADKLGGVEKLFRLVGIVAASAFGVVAYFKLLKFIEVIKKMDKSLLSAKLKVLGFVAVIALIALLVEDFFKFMKGEDSLIGSLFDKSGIGAENARQAILKAWGAIKEFLLATWGAIQSFLSEHSEQIKEMFRVIWDAIAQILSVAFLLISTLAKAVFGALQSFWEKWGDKIMAAFQVLAAFFGRFFGRVIEVIRQFAEFLSAIFAGDIQGALQSLLGIFQTILENIIDLVKTIFTAIWAFIGDKVIAIKDTIVNGFTAAIDWIKSLPSQAIQWGADIIQGIVDGINGAIGKVGDAVKGVASKIKSFIGFSEPDEGPLSNFHTYMPDMIDLMTQGINAGKSKVTDALKAVTGEMSVVAQYNAVSPATISKASGGSGVSRSITQNVEINNQFNGDRAGQEKSSTAMDKASGDATSEMARAIAFAR